MWAIMKEGKYVAKPGSSKSYTRKLKDADVYHLRTTAKLNACDDEHVIHVPKIAYQSVKR